MIAYFRGSFRFEDKRFGIFRIPHWLSILFDEATNLSEIVFLPVQTAH